MRAGSVNFGIQTDCGIFLDHRDTRAEIRELMKSAAKLLNLFAYTGSLLSSADVVQFHHNRDLPTFRWAKRDEV